MPDRRELVTSIVTAVVAALACSVSIQFATPIDRALPFLAVVVVALNAPIAVLPLIAIENVIADEPTRLLAIGIVLAIAFAFASVERAPLVAFLAVLVLRWIPLHDVVIWRELIILAGAVAVAYVMKGPTLAVVLGLFSPAWPAKVAVVLFAVAILAAFLWSDRRPRLSAPWRTGEAPVPPLILALIIAFFPWSGVMARGWMAFIRHPRQAPRVELRYALPPGRTMTIDVPEHVEAIVVSGANVQRLPCGTVLGWMNGAPIAAPDWGFMRREQFFASRNCYPRNPAGRIRGYGWSAWIDGAERILLPYGAKSIRIAVNPQLPKSALLQIEAFE